MKQLLYLIALLLLIMLAWDTVFLYPLKLLVVFFHESSHALATLLTGGSVKELVINKDQGIALLTHWSNDYGWTHWHTLPTFDKRMEFKQ
jgi:hypothetical protein